MGRGPGSVQFRYLPCTFVKADNLSFKEVKQCIQSFIFGVNTPSRWGSQAPFTNITLDWTVPTDLKSRKAIVGGKEQDFTYGECRAEMDMINKAFIELMILGDADGRDLPILYRHTMSQVILTGNLKIPDSF